MNEKEKKALADIVGVFKELTDRLLALEKQVALLKHSVENPDPRLSGCWRDPHEAR